MAKDIIFFWSGGKDSCLALEAVQESGEYRIATLLTTLIEGAETVTAHGVPRTLIERQAASLELPLHFFHIRKGASNQEYEAGLGSALSRYRDTGIRVAAFGDLFLQDIRAYREKLMSRLGMESIFPIWGHDSAALIHRFIASGYKAIVSSVYAGSLDHSWAGRQLDGQFIAELPTGVDPCGENGEFHSFVYDGPLFKKALTVSVGGVELRDGHYLCDLKPGC